MIKSKAFKIFSGIILLIGIIWGLTHYFGSESQINMVGNISIGVFALVIVSYLGYMFTRKPR